MPRDASAIHSATPALAPGARFWNVLAERFGELVGDSDDVEGVEGAPLPGDSLESDVFVPTVEDDVIIVDCICWIQDLNASLSVGANCVGSASDALLEVGRASHPLSSLLDAIVSAVSLVYKKNSR
jgi:hypothetical protein